MSTINIPWEDFEVMHDFSSSTKKYSFVDENLVDETHRWYLVYELVFEEVQTGKLFKIITRKGKTEYQENEKAIDTHSKRDFVECQEVRQV